MKTETVYPDLALTNRVPRPSQSPSSEQLRQIGLIRREDAAHLLNRLGGYCGVHEASVLNGLSFDPFSFQQDCFASPEVDIGGCQVADGLVITPVVVVIDEGVDLGLEIIGQIIDAVLQTLVSALDLALGLGMEGSGECQEDCVGTIRG
jgi:hypothetical protein